MLGSYEELGATGGGNSHWLSTLEGHRHKSSSGFYQDDDVYRDDIDYDNIDYDNIDYCDVIDYDDILAALHLLTSVRLATPKLQWATTSLKIILPPRKSQLSNNCDSR